MYDKLYTNNRSVFSMHYTLVLVTKYKAAVITSAVSNRLMNMFDIIGKHYKVVRESWRFSSDCIRVDFRGEPLSELSKFVNAYKAASSRIVKQEFPQVRAALVDNSFWSGSMLLFTTGTIADAVIDSFVEKQGRSGK